MRERIPQSAAVRVTFDAYLASDHITPATGKTIAVTLSKNGAAFGNPSAGATNATEIGGGSYYVDLSITDTGTLGPAIVKVTEGTIDTAKLHFDVTNDGALFTTALLATAIPNSNTAGTVADALNAARAQGFGKWTLVGTALSLYGADNTTVVRAFTLDSSTAPTSRT